MPTDGYILVMYRYLSIYSKPSRYTGEGTIRYRTFKVFTIREFFNDSVPLVIVTTYLILFLRNRITCKYRRFRNPSITDTCVVRYRTVHIIRLNRHRKKKLAYRKRPTTAQQTETRIRTGTNSRYGAKPLHSIS